MVKFQSDCSVLFIIKTYTGFVNIYVMDPNILIYALNDFKVTCSKMLQNF